jgi:hypothetical protein
MKYMAMLRLLRKTLTKRRMIRVEIRIRKNFRPEKEMITLIVTDK